MKKTEGSPLKFLSIDIGGSHIKATILNEKGELKMSYEKIATPKPSTPESVVAAIKQLAKSFPGYDRISVGFPGYVKNGVIKTAPNLGTESWKDFDLSKKLEEELGAPARVVNDADMQGLGLVSGKGLEMVVTLGTGFGTALLVDGQLMPHLEISHHPISKGKDYDEYIGDKALQKEGVQKWNRRMKKVLSVIKTVVNYDTLYIGGGNSDKLKFKLDKDIKIVSNIEGIRGGARLWQSDHRHDLITATPVEEVN
ncbi:ROK family protein [Mucilaginibacter ginsenosidivorans]|uniref:ROK family protein n=1 Tax=Mucilaginibacter ginsenosidivorans TaxID=398053 RepID=A0A5B8UZ44_9SPHI|nr:ROK family protein [Mucilaginibacter ginsenosidivorans]QEC64374.1 ROK family protein [Mucilaginibacter ginsenosidivorans]